MRLSRVFALALLACASVAGPVFAKGDLVGYVEPKNQTNPAPSVTLNSFQHFEMLPIAIDAPYAGQKANEAARTEMQANLDQHSKPVLDAWNAQAPAEAARTLKIEPTIRHIRFVSSGKRLWGGALAGNSAVLVTVKLTDASTGEVVAEPEFYQHANGKAGAWTFGAADKAMLIRITSMVTEYLQSNYAAQVGGATRVAPGAKS